MNLRKLAATTAAAHLLTGAKGQECIYTTDVTRKNTNPKIEADIQKKLERLFPPSPQTEWGAKTQTNRDNTLEVNYRISSSSPGDIRKFVANLANIKTAEIVVKDASQNLKKCNAQKELEKQGRKYKRGKPYSKASERQYLSVALDPNGNIVHGGRGR